MLFKWCNLHMLRRKKNEHQRVKKETRFPSALIPWGWIPTAERATGRSSVRYLHCVRPLAPVPLPLPLLLRRDGAGSAGSTAPVHSGWQTAPPAPPRTALSSLRSENTSQSKRSVTAFHLLRCNAVPKKSAWDTWSVDEIIFQLCHYVITVIFFLTTMLNMI